MHTQDDGELALLAIGVVYFHHGNGCAILAPVAESVKQMDIAALVLDRNVPDCRLESRHRLASKQECPRNIKQDAAEVLQTFGDNLPVRVREPGIAFGAAGFTVELGEVNGLGLCVSLGFRKRRSADWERAICRGQKNWAGAVSLGLRSEIELKKQHPPRRTEQEALGGYHGFGVV